ncbi:MAG: NAD-dependent epimerase/dehydratase family protein [Candidatus Aminicenantaceae bacterium]
MTHNRPKILVTGAGGQIGSALTPMLRTRFGAGDVIASDIRDDISAALRDSGPYLKLDVTQPDDIRRSLEEHRIDIIYHMSAILSATGESQPQLAWTVNMNGTFNILEAARKAGVRRVFVPSSIAAFGPETPREDTPQETVLRPKTMYGITKVAGELLCDYYVLRYGLDVRGCRYPGIISHETLPGGGTTDYAVEIFYAAVKYQKFTCFLKPDTMLPMMYMPDCLKATCELMEVNFDRLKHHSDFNISSMSFTPEKLAAEIRTHIPEFMIEYQPDYRQQIAESWPRSIDDSSAREEWDWKPDFNLATMTADMLRVLGERHARGALGY